MSYKICDEKQEKIINIIQQHLAGKVFTTIELMQITEIQQIGLSKSGLNQALKQAKEQGDIIVTGRYRITPKAGLTNHYMLNPQPKPKPKPAPNSKSEPHKGFKWPDELNNALYRGLTIPLQQYAIHQHRMKDSQR